MRHAIAILLPILALAACSPSQQDQTAHGDAVAEATDYTPPSVMSRVDYGALIDRRFRALDHNEDNRLTGDELPRANSRLMALDANHDGAISQQEWSKGLLARFDARDVNHDGTVTSYERDLSANKL